MMKSYIYVPIFSAILLAACNQTQATKPAEAVDKADMTFVQTFSGNCLQNFLDFERIEAAAKTFKWKHVTDPDMLKMIGPADPGADWKAWLFKSEGRGFMLAVGERELDGKPLGFCVLVSEPTDIEATRKKLIEMLHAEHINSSEEGGQRYDVYRFVSDGKPALLNFIDAVPMGMKTLNASMMAAPNP